MSNNGCGDKYTPLSPFLEVLKGEKGDTGAKGDPGDDGSLITVAFDGQDSNVGLDVQVASDTPNYVFKAYLAKPEEWSKLSTGGGAAVDPQQLPSDTIALSYRRRFIHREGNPVVFKSQLELTGVILIPEGSVGGSLLNALTLPSDISPEKRIVFPCSQVDSGNVINVTVDTNGKVGVWLNSTLTDDIFIDLSPIGYEITHQ